MSALERQAASAVAVAVCATAMLASCAWAGTGETSNADKVGSIDHANSPRTGHANIHHSPIIGKVSVSTKTAAPVQLQAQKATEDMPPVAPNRQAIDSSARSFATAANMTPVAVSAKKTALFGSAVANNADEMPPLAPQVAKFGRAPLLGSVLSNNAPSEQLGNPQQGQLGQFGQQPFSLPVHDNRVPQLSVHQTPIGTANVTQSNWRQAIPLVHVGIGLVPGMRGMSCPICGMLNKL